jgi:hypothetical protein
MKQVFGLPGPNESHLLPPFIRMLAEFDRHKESVASVPNVLFHQLDRARFRAGLAEIPRRFYAERFPGGSFRDKTPGPAMIEGASFIHEIFPEAKIVVTMRTGIEQVESFRRKFNESGLRKPCRIWTATMRAIERLQAEVPQALVIDQFDFTNAPEAVAQRICALLGQPERTGEVAAFFLTERMQQKSTHDWSRRQTLADTGWSEAEQAEFREECGALMERFGYPM